MKQLVAVVWFFMAMVNPASLAAQQAGSDSLAARADSLYDALAETEALEAYERILQEHPRNYKALWRASFLHSRIGYRQDRQESKERYYNEAKLLAERALEVDSADAQSHFVMSVALGRMALISGARERVAASRDIKKHVDRSLAFDSTHAGAWHVLGRWHYKVANLNFVERLAANTLFGGIPGDAGNDKAAGAIEQAIKFNDKYVMYYHDLAMVYDEMGDTRKAIDACETALKLKNLSPDDPDLKDECKEWIEEWK